MRITRNTKPHQVSPKEVMDAFDDLAARAVAYDPSIADDIKKLQEFWLLYGAEKHGECYADAIGAIHREFLKSELDKFYSGIRKLDKGIYVK